MKLHPYDTNCAVEPFGIKNVGSLCYLNALVQALFSLPSFINCLSSSCLSDKTLATKLLEVQTTHTTVDVLRAIQLARSRGSHTSSLHSNCEEDAFEGLKFIIESLGENIETLFHVRHRQRIVCRACGHAHTVQLRACPPEIMVNMAEKTPILQKNLTTQEQLEKYIKLHMLYPSGYKCEACGIFNTQTSLRVCQFYALARLSSIIVLSFHGFQQTLFNNTKKGRLPQKRAVRYFPQYLSFVTKDAQPLRYRAVAQVEQSGCLARGHYIAKCLRKCPKTKKLEVYLFNGASIVRLPNGIKPSPNTYLVFYHLEK